MPDATPPDLDTLRARIAGCMGWDRAAFERRLNGIVRARRAGRDTSHGHAAVADAIEHSEALRRRRTARVPHPRFDEPLPILLHREAIAAAIDDNPVVVVCGETGSGKTTQLPQIALALGRGVDRRIGHTQPRRIAARSVATRIAEELAVPLGEEVGYQVRFDDRTGPDTYVKLMTDGILLAETQHDAYLHQYDTIIVEEAHERSLNIDFLLGYLKQLLTRRDDLKVIVTSATIDPDRFSRHFDGAPVIQVSGRTYPVDIRYAPTTEDEEPLDALSDAVVACAAEGPGDILVFLPSERDIRDALRALGRRHEGMELVPLFGRLSVAEQMRVFHPGRRRRVVLATNVAETSITVPGIRYVIDSGLARVSRYSTQARVQRLPIERISKASATQRAGRCGRVQDGVCIRLYDEREYGKRDDFTAPEIRRSNLAAVILQMKALGLGDIEAFPFVDPPQPGRIREGYLTLFELGAVDDGGELSDLGRTLARLPIDPRLGRIVVEGHRLRCLEDALVLVAFMSIQDPRERPFEAREDADRVHAQFAHPESDVRTVLGLWARYRDAGESRGSSALKRWCKEHYLAPGRMREWLDVHRQLLRVTSEAGIEPSGARAKEQTVYRAFLAGLLSNIGGRSDRTAYHGAGGHQFWLWPGSVLAKDRPKWVVVGERVETSRLFGRLAAPIDPAWIEPLAAHLVERSWFDVHWNEQQGHVYAFERVTLFGVEIVAKRRVHFAPLAPKRAREVFIRHALVHGRLRTRARFFRHNRELLARIEDMESRARRRGLVADVADRFAFYDARIPADVASGPALERWLRDARGTDPRLLYMDEADLLVDPSSVPGQVPYPDTMDVAGSPFRLRYRYEPGHARDGVTLEVPLEALAQVDGTRLEWIVPGLLPEKVTALLRALPKARRRPLVPLTDTVDEILEALPFADGSLADALGRRLEALGHGAFPVTLWDATSLPPYLHVNVAVVDGKGRTIDEDRDLPALRGRLLAEREAARGSAPAAVEHTDLRDWTIGDLPERVATRRSGFTVNAYPALRDRGDSVALSVEDTPERAARVHRLGVRRLLAIALQKDVAPLLRRMPDKDVLGMIYGTLGDAVPFERALEDRIVADAAGLETATVTTRAAFDAAVSEARRRLLPSGEAAIDAVRRILEPYQEVAQRLMLEPPAIYRPAIDDMVGQLGVLLSRDFIRATPREWLDQIPRYLEAIGVRLRKLAGGGLARDERDRERIARHWARFRKRDDELRAQGVENPELERYRWWIEELRVSLFAQELGTYVKISEKRLDTQWDRASALGV